MRRLFAALALMLAPVAAPVAAQSMVEGTFRADVPTLEQVVGHRSGTRISSPEQALTYMRALAEAEPERMRLVEYARSWEGRPLVYAVISSPANMARIEAVQADLAQLAQGAAPSSLGNVLPVTWLGYGVHGDEISSTDAALSLAYHLLAAQNDTAVDRILNNTVVVIDPSQNPDGRARFVNSFMAQSGIAASGDRYSAAADQPWPGGRFNHYLFDLNRDWFAVTQPETRGRIAAVRQWQPVVVVDAHEMGGDDSYFFPPVADPINPNVTQGQRDLMGLLGRNNAAAMDRIGQPYFTREVFDLFYPGYGDSWPTHNGAVGMTFEQASARGLAWERKDGSVLTYADGVRNHFTTTFATALTVADNAQRFLTEYAAYRRSAVAGQVGGSGGYVIDLAQRPWNAEQLARRLVTQGIAVRRVAGPATVCGRSYPAGYLSVSTAQASGRLIRSLLDADTPLPTQFVQAQESRRDRGLAHELYDTTAWSVGQMSGLAVRECAVTGAGTLVGADDPLPARAEAPGAFGLAVPWTDSGQVRLVTEALAAGLVGRATNEAFTMGSRTFPRGTVVFARGDNPEKLDELTAIATRIGAETVALGSGWTDSGPNMGSDAFVRLSRNPRVAMLWDDGVDPTSAGALRYTLEQRLGIPVTAIRTGTVGQANLGRYDVLLVPDGYYSEALGSGARAAIATYARSGGVVVAIGNALTAFNSGDNALFALQRETVLGGEPAKDDEDEKDGAAGEAIGSEADYLAAIADPHRSPDVLPGALLNTAIDADSFLSAGYDQAAPVVFAAGDLVFAPMGRADGTNVVRYAAAPDLVASGYVWAENRRQMAFKPFMVAQGTGGGLAIGFTQDPAMRGYLDGLDLLLANAVLMAPARVR
ncbi:M14 family metallopeptidase [Alteraurantiacibacter buctensis]|uniref:Carboxypeptidase n=1 Tax=Alteraurantiacibacter buctensis TaxID=1503981 RepID=A0A844YW74_9SPHN|nr:M14 family metallopeptidase [Alteraurantiacibacter buctensis]MXO71382.1 carboxypeptidase [Alteraurantiacibacter buctensis]